MAKHDPQLKARMLDEGFARVMTAIRASRCPTPPDAIAEAYAIFYDELALSGEALDGLAARLVPLFADSAASQADLRRRIEGVLHNRTPQTEAEIENEEAALTWRKHLSRIVGACVVIGGLIAVSIFLWVPSEIGEPPELLPPKKATAQPVTEVDRTVYPPIPLADGLKESRQTELIVRLNEPHAWRSWAIVGSILFPLFLVFLWITLRNEQRRHLLSLVLRGPDAPSDAIARSYRENEIPLASSLAATGSNLGAASDLSSGVMDVRATVQATVRAGGFLTPVEETTKGHADYVVLIEKKGPNDHLARLVDQILNRIDTAGLSIRRYYYRDDPIAARPAEGDVSALPLREVISGGARHRFLVVGSSAGFFHPITGKLQSWTEALSTLASRTLLSARPVDNWSYEEEDLRNHGFAIGEASPIGMAAYGEAVAAGRESSPLILTPGADVRQPVATSSNAVQAAARGLRASLPKWSTLRLASLATPLAATVATGALIAVLLAGAERAFVAKPPPVQQETAALAELDRARASAPFGIPAEAWVEGVLGDAGSVFREVPGTPDMVVIPTGIFRMGSPDQEEGREPDEGPQRDVGISRFALSRTEVTFAQWQACVDGGGCQSNPSPDDEGWGRDDRPVIDVTWDEAQEFLAWLNAVIEPENPSGPYRLPTEAEWEYAARARAGDSREMEQERFFWGNDPKYADGCAFANGADAAALARNPTWEGMNCDDGYVETAPVGSFLANGFSLQDMSGNVWEWVEDCWHDSYEGAPKDGSAWVSGRDGDCGQRVLRGGSWVNDPGYLRSANRGRFEAVDRDVLVGFRLARTLTP